MALTRRRDPQRSVRDTSPQASDTTEISLRNISKTYTASRGTAVRAVVDFSLDVSPGEFITLVGPSGCGKSTILKMLAGLVPPTSGSIELRGHPLTGSTPEIGVVYQQPLLLPWRTVLDNVMVPVEVLKLPKSEYREKARELLELLGLADFEKSYPHQLSGGMQQRVGIARALVYDPAILLMDEPFGALDAITRDQMSVELMRISSKFRKTVIFVTHSITEAVLLADRVVVMTPRPGQIADVLDVALPRPRDLAVVNTSGFGVLAEKVRDLLQIDSTGGAVTQEGGEG